MAQSGGCDMADVDDSKARISETEGARAQGVVEEIVTQRSVAPQAAPHAARRHAGRLSEKDDVSPARVLREPEEQFAGRGPQSSTRFGATRRCRRCGDRRTER